MTGQHRADFSSFFPFSFPDAKLPFEFMDAMREQIIGFGEMWKTNDLTALTFYEKTSKEMDALFLSMKSQGFHGIDTQGFNAIRNLSKTLLMDPFRIPRLGLIREHQERMDTVLDRMAAFQVNLLEFLYYMGIPVEKTLQQAGKDILELIQEGNFQQLSKVYEKTVGDLEKAYHEQFHSGHYTRALANVITTLGHLKTTLKEISHEAGRYLGFPSETSMEALYMDVYTMKKEIAEIKEICSKNPVIQAETSQNG
ncbi:hypothetical protein OOT00_13510 [Desulfobotulus sp. H1]|uniref:Poly(3-hydroxyalkanoate) polymerase subunit PhaE n=1 Tax=Desulfobotulus pelophilus TaxID=2823377 RepID=A0ABT3NC16_9BACT|nr:poly(R)-hydroxyalkanoic acid synthase subunit PhaE [Desulfobotulus pelophilus]MCW7755004.1 hypothetical protein [Desulfobotulus pelophilus]